MQLLGKILFGWYIISLGWTLIECRNDIPLLIIGECINILCLIFIGAALSGYHTFVINAVGFLLLIWFSYYIWIDMQTPNIIFAIFYTIIDAYTLIYIINCLITYCIAPKIHVTYISSLIKIIQEMSYILTFGLIRI